MARGKYRGKKAGWRQQKLAVNTVKKIAKAVTRLEMQKKTEPKFSINVLGQPAPTLIQENFSCVLYRSGLYLITLNGPATFLQGTNMLKLQHHPQTVPTFNLGTGLGGATIESGPRTRIGDTIEMTGLDVSGYITLGKTLEHATVHIGLYKADQTLVNGVVPLLPKLSGMQIRRQIDFTEVPNKIVSKTFTINHSANSTSTRRKFQLYHRFKKSRRVKYNDGQTSDQTINEARYMDDRYYLVMYSDRPDLQITGGIPPNQIVAADYKQYLDDNVQFIGRYTAYYRDS